MLRSIACACASTIAVVVVLFSSPGAHAGDVIRIEEHWELTVGGPDWERCAPQVSLVMSPHSDINCDYFVFTLNHATFPSFTPGGMQIQRWNGDQVQATTNTIHPEILFNEGEVIAWRQILELSDGVVSFKVRDGTSTTWGPFGYTQYLTSSYQSGLSRLNDYRPAISMEESGIAFAGNRVSSLVLKKLIWETTDGNISVFEAPIDIDTDLDP